MTVRDMEGLRALLARLENPLWMRDPASWVWQRGDGAPQGPGLLVRAHQRGGDHAPGFCNLQWLAMDLDTPPRHYDLGHNLLYSILSLHALGARLAGEPLLDVAGIVPLRQFAAMLPPQVTSSQPAEKMYPLLRVLAERRLAYANP